MEFPISFVAEPTEAHERQVIKGLSENLKAEDSGILAWLIRGCLQWQVDGGLNPPSKVKAATDEYHKEEDLLAEFLEDCCVSDSQAMTTSKELYSTFELWFQEKLGKKVPAQKTFGKLMGKKFDRRKSNGVKCYTGVKLRQDIKDIQGNYSLTP